MKKVYFFIILSFLLVFASCEKPATPELNPDFLMISSNEFRAPTEVTFMPLDDIRNADYFWKFDDGTTSTEKNPRKLFIAFGTRSIRLEISVNGTVKVKIKTLTIAPKFNEPNVIRKKLEGNLGFNYYGKKVQRKV